MADVASPGHLELAQLYAPISLIRVLLPDSRAFLSSFTVLKIGSFSAPINPSITIVATEQLAFAARAPGNSGGPVIYSPALKIGQGLNSPLINDEELIGIVSSFIPYQEPAISPQTQRVRVVFEENSDLQTLFLSGDLLN
jgi:hypothetical protein